MRTLTAIVALAAFALPVAAGPIDSLQYRTTLVTDRSPGYGPVPSPGETVYPLGDSPAFGVVAGGVPDWRPATPAYPSASFGLIHLGALTPYIASNPAGIVDLHGAGQYRLDLEIRDASGNAGVLSFRGAFTAGWSYGHGYAGPDINPAPQSLWLGHTRYDVEVMNGLGGPYYVQDENGSWQPVWYAVDPVPGPSGAYFTESGGEFSALITPTATPEPGTLALVGMGLSGALLTLRLRRAGA